MQAYCETGDHYPEEVIADSGAELGVIVYGNGEVSNRWEDGIVGVPAAASDRAYADDEPVCPDHHCCVSWRRA
ncbi:MAG: hypothetical protein HUU17_06295 [Chthonomonadales bacterium]|nr:hypothetical protein [Chthonomonadales bacterium]